MRRVLILGLGLGLAGAALAGPRQGKPEQAAAAVKRVGKAFSKLSSYRVEAEIRGGQAQGAEHGITQATVQQRYDAAVVKRLCRVESPEAYRPRFDSQAGAIAGPGGYKAMLATPDGRLLARLFLPAEQLLAEAARYRKTARWLDAGGHEAPPPQVLTTRSDDTDARPVTGTRTGDDRDRDSTDSAGEAEAAAPHRLRVQGPSSVALEHFLTIQNSGCFSAG